MSFETDYRREFDTIKLSEEARERINEALEHAPGSATEDIECIEVPIGVKLVEQTPRHRRWHPGVWVPAATFLACAALLLIALPAVLSIWGGFTKPMLSTSTDASMAESAPPETTGIVASARSYADIFDKISALLPSEGVYDMVYGEAGPMPGGVVDAPREPGRGDAQSSASDTAQAQPDLSFMTESSIGGFASKEKEYSTTNVQVEGIDEADIVKTDGEYLYILSGRRIVIAKADGKDTRSVSEISLDLADSFVDVYQLEPAEMFLDKDRLIVIATEYPSYEYPIIYDEVVLEEIVQPPTSLLGRLYNLLTDRLFGTSEVLQDDRVSTAIYDDRWYPSDVRTIALVFDVSHPASPRQIARSGQDGSYVTSRMIDGIVYLITTHYLSGVPRLEDPRTFVPSLYLDEKQTVLEADRVVVPSCPESTGYVVISSLSTKTGSHIDSTAMLGYTSTIYMSADNLYVAQGSYGQKVIDSWHEGPYLVEHVFEGSTTDIARFSVARGRFSYQNNTVVPGDLLNQFSLDEFDGTLRVVVTASGNEMKIYTDEQRGFVNYEYLDTPRSEQSNALYVIAMDGSLIGEVSDLAPGERVYSVRFDGTIAYFVTFRQVDPLFAVDLTDPRDPVVLGALKIPGFSQYLHVYGDGLLLGLGMEADVVTGRTSTMKLSMFDTSNPRDIYEKHKLVLDATYSEALSNHKAILVLPDRGLIAFPAEDGFVVFSYSPKTGFTQRSSMRFVDAYNSRGVVIEDLLYVCAPTGIGVFRLDTFSLLTHLTF